MENKAQASIEIMVLIGGAIVAATVIGIYLKGLATDVGGRIVTETDSAINN
jgi:uncharacterized protein (UPF0333 family)